MALFLSSSLSKSKYNSKKKQSKRGGRNLSSSPKNYNLFGTFPKSHSPLLKSKRSLHKIDKSLKYPMKTMSRLDEEIKHLNQTIETNKKLATNLAEKRDLISQMSEKGLSTATSTSPNIKRGEGDTYTVKEMIEAEAELEEANALLSYRKALRERLRTRITTMKQAADVTWKAYKGRGKSRKYSFFDNLY